MASRRRLSSEESRAVAMEAARRILIEAGPQAVTLKAVANRIDRTHANLLHHFGSAAGLQSSLAQHLAAMVCSSIAETVQTKRIGLGQPREVVDLAFDAFGREGGGALATWMLVSDNHNALDPIVAMIGGLLGDIRPPFADEDYEREIHEVTLALILLALGDALLGPRLAGSLNVSRNAARDRAELMLAAVFAKYSNPPDIRAQA